MIFLIGMPGAGKTYWAKILSKEYKLTLIDTDEEIERKYGDIIQIFTKYGESFFRQKESYVLDAIIRDYNGSKSIIACGGGTPVYHKNMTKMLNAGCVVYLHSTLEVLYERLYKDKKRPLLVGQNPRSYLEELYRERKCFYERAHYILNEPVKINSFQTIIRECTN